MVRTITNEIICKYKNIPTYTKIIDGIIKGDIRNVLLGKSDYEITAQPIPTSTDADFITIVLHIAIKERITTNEVINNTFKSIIIDKDNVCLLLSYIYYYLEYSEAGNNIYNLDYMPLYKKILSKTELKPFFKFNIYFIDNLIYKIGTTKNAISENNTKLDIDGANSQNQYIFDNWKIEKRCERYYFIYKLDCGLINPVIITKEDFELAIDGKMNKDDFLNKYNLW